MASEAINAIDACKDCIDAHKSFVLRGGAGSGKTESLKELLLYIKRAHPNARVICITHTNAAVDEIVSRVGEQYPISTIHSFLYELIGHYRKNIKTVISELFFIPQMIRAEPMEGISEAEYKNDEHVKYKKVYEKYSNKLYTICKENCEKVVGKREYDKDPVAYNQALNEKIQALNTIILERIQAKDHSKIYYNETKFDSLNDLSYGHDGLLTIFHLLFEKYSLLEKIIADKFDYIFIDEYQDTQAEILNDLLTLPVKYELAIGLFGDSMQSIYDGGIDNIEDYAHDSTLLPISKPDNFRCSYEVIKVINALRLDDISQEVALKKLSNGEYETEADRHGFVKVLYTITDKKPTTHSSAEEKEKYQLLINSLIVEAQKRAGNSKILVLTNKAIAEKNNFQQLYKVFNDRYIDVSDRIENYLRSIQALDVSDLCSLYLKKNYNELIRLVRKGGYVIHSISDKKNLHDIIQGIIDSQSSIYEIVETAIKHKLIKRTETYRNISERNVNFLEQLKADELYQKFKGLYLSGQNTFNRVKDSVTFASEEEFEYHESLLKRECFITELSSPKLKFSEVLNYTKYLNEETEYITMHKTKGTSIPSVIVVMEEYFWTEYDFSLLYQQTEKSKALKRINSQKLIYVACSRARNNLVCVKVLTDNEVSPFLQIFPQAEFVNENKN